MYNKFEYLNWQTQNHNNYNVNRYNQSSQKSNYNAYREAFLNANTFKENNGRYPERPY